MNKTKEQKERKEGGFRTKKRNRTKDEEERIERKKERELRRKKE